LFLSCRFNCVRVQYARKFSEILETVGEEFVAVLEEILKILLKESPNYLLILVRQVNSIVKYLLTRTTGYNETLKIIIPFL